MSNQPLNLLPSIAKNALSKNKSIVADHINANRIQVFQANIHNQDQLRLTDASATAVSAGGGTDIFTLTSSAKYIRVNIPFFTSVPADPLAADASALLVVTNTNVETNSSVIVGNRTIVSAGAVVAPFIGLQQIAGQLTIFIQNRDSINAITADGELFIQIIN